MFEFVKVTTSVSTYEPEALVIPHECSAGGTELPENLDPEPGALADPLCCGTPYSGDTVQPDEQWVGSAMRVVLTHLRSRLNEIRAGDILLSYIWLRNATGICTESLDNKVESCERDDQVEETY
jgi:hypothetical protein